MLVAFNTSSVISKFSIQLDALWVPLSPVYIPSRDLQPPALVCRWCLFLIKNFFWPHYTARGILAPRSGIKPIFHAVEMQSLNHWTTREGPVLGILYAYCPVVKLVHSIWNSTSTFLFPLSFHCRASSHLPKRVCGRQNCWVPMYVKQLSLPSHLFGSLTGCVILGWKFTPRACRHCFTDV